MQCCIVYRIRLFNKSKEMHKLLLSLHFFLLGSSSAVWPLPRNGNWNCNCIHNTTPITHLMTFCFVLFCMQFYSICASTTTKLFTQSENINSHHVVKSVYIWAYMHIWLGSGDSSEERTSLNKSIVKRRKPLWKMIFSFSISHLISIISHRIWTMTIGSRIPALQHQQPTTFTQFPILFCS